ncbi:CDP-glycerol glycerophosphotransferase family protein [Curtobacterium sp. ISL-83]|uniref:CDP-glycerol glycerophosphotransferase family protein n=1 Tax=Curtobacterium sp. ISL-83 TaxID=2819145 RepID=UPI001BEAB90E|nr:CDP-glycerol glycerophosphotransferase family protein [Curtobacterium sp. ISL-83]MBT2501044.1 CDP-glycerol glycerophosphotransferase family protein [Curtobacterium sp. ISL-83]
MNTSGTSASRRRFDRRFRSEVRAFWRTRPVDRNVVFYESFNGNGVLCSPEAVFRSLVTDPDRQHLRHVWSLSDENDNAAVRQEFRDHPRVRFVQPGSTGAVRAMATAGWLISNATFDRQFDKRPEQTYVNTWHGTPLKNMGFEIGDPASRVANVLRNFLQADVLVSPNAFTTDVLFRRAHRLDGVMARPVLETGYPRIDRQFLDAAAVRSVRADLVDRGLDVGDRRIVLWAPTWRGTSFARPEDDADLLLERVAAMQAALDPAEFVVLLKTHQVVHHLAAQRAGARGVLVPNDIPTNVLLGVTDTLVTDYSSIFFDFLALDRPIVFFVPDVQEYASYRGLAIPTAEWPGPRVTTPEAVGAAVASTTDDGSARAAMRQRMSAHDDGGATARLIRAVFDQGAGGDPRTTTTDPGSPTRKSLLVVVPASAREPLAAEVVAVLNALDHDRIDVSVLLSDSRSRWYLTIQSAFDPRIRQLVRQGNTNGSGFVRGRAAERKWSREWHRIVADIRFDAVVDASGGSPFWRTLVAAARAGSVTEWGRGGGAETVASLTQALGDGTATVVR